MKAEKLREALNECEYCKNFNIKSVSCKTCVGIYLSYQNYFELNDELKTELEKLEKDAEIGRAAKKMLEQGMFIYNIVETHEGELYKFDELNSVEELLGLYREENDNEL